MRQEDDVRQNAILGALPEPEFAQLRDRLEMIEAEIRDQVYEPDKAISDVYFPVSAVYSMVGLADGRVQVEVATIGREGMAGLPVFLGRSASPHAAFCQIGGLAARMPADELRKALANGTALHGLLNRFAQATMVQIGQNVVCNSTHHLSQRAARWLLATQDRVRSDEFPLTQDFLSQMLGASRPTVSQTAGNLQSLGLIRYVRGKVTIADRPGLEQAACSCYAIVKAEFDGLVNGP
jgi:CRP-like cAMP-binding protein